MGGPHRMNRQGEAQPAPMGKNFTNYNLPWHPFMGFCGISLNLSRSSNLIYGTQVYPRSRDMKGHCNLVSYHVP